MTINEGESAPDVPQKRGIMVENIIDAVNLVTHLATHYEGIRLCDLTATVAARNGWSQPKLHNMLRTFEHVGWCRRTPTGAWALSSSFAILAVAYHESIIRRSSALLAEVAQVKSQAAERSNTHVNH